LEDLKKFITEFRELPEFFLGVEIFPGGPKPPTDNSGYLAVFQIREIIQARRQVAVMVL
jgi:hypothetical protein